MFIINNESLNTVSTAYALFFFLSSNSSFTIIADHPWLQNAKKAPNVPLGDIVRMRLKQFSVMNRFKKKALRVSLKVFYYYLLNSKLLNESQFEYNSIGQDIIHGT